MGMFKRKITVSDDVIDVHAVHLTLKQSILPNLLVTILFFLWGFAYGLLDVLNSHFQTELKISASRASGKNNPYISPYSSLTHRQASPRPTSAPTSSAPSPSPAGSFANGASA
jgi:hypothetical protein